MSEKVWIFGTTGHLLVDEKRAREIQKEYSGLMFLYRGGRSWKLEAYCPPEDPNVRAVHRLGVKTW